VLIQSINFFSLLCVIIYFCSVIEEKLRILSLYFVNGVNSSHKTRRTSFDTYSTVARWSRNSLLFVDPKESLRYLEDCNWTLSWVSWIHFAKSCLFFFFFCRFVLILCSHLQLLLPNDVLPLCFATNTLCALLVSVACVTTRAQLRLSISVS